MAILTISIKPKSGTNVPQDLPGAYALVRYACLADPLTDETGAPFDGVQEEEFRLSTLLAGGTEVWDWDDFVLDVEIAISSPFGFAALPSRPLRASDPVAVGGQRRGDVCLELTQADIDSINQNLRPAATQSTTPALSRKGQFFALGGGTGNLPDHMFVACLSAKPGKDVLGDASQKVFKTNEVKDIAPIADFVFLPVRLGARGSFEFTIPLTEDCAGWLWMLPGKTTTVGWIDDPVLLEKPEEKEAAASVTKEAAAPVTKEAAAPITILLAAESVSSSDGGEGEDGSSPSAGQIVPMDASEQDQLENPDVYAEDPGIDCEPFRNPHRILSERTFSTILRVKEPAIGGLPSPRPPIGPVIPGAIIPGAVIPGTIAKDAGSVTAPKLSVWRRLFTRSEKATATLSGAEAKVISPAPSVSLADVLAARRGHVTPGTELRRIFPRLRIPPIFGTTGRRGVTASTPIDWEGDASRYQATTVGLGHILEFRVRWRSNGYSLGDVLHTLTLAPRQTKRITTVQWARTERAARTEASRAGDTVRQETTGERQYSDAVESTLREWSKGGSKSSTTGVAGGIGFAVGPVIVGGGAAHGESGSSSWQQGGRDVSAQEEQSLRDAIRQYADSLRRFESSVVTEITQEEVVTGISEVLRNPNYCHALTVVYHQILRHLRVDTELVGVRECVFVPLAIKPFTLERAIRWRDTIAGRLLAEDLRWVLKYLDELKAGFPDDKIPDGPRSSHPIRYVSGSVFVKLAIQRPPDKDDDSFDEGAWGVFGSLIPQPLFEVFAHLREQAVHKRDQVFQSEIAPGVARTWADALQLFVSKKRVGTDVVMPAKGFTVGELRKQLAGEFVQVENVDFTLASSYRYNGTVRVDFSWVVPPGTALTRADLQSIKVLAGGGLVKGSIADLISMAVHYETDTFQHDVSSSRCTDDLIRPDTGAVDTRGASAWLSLDPWENQDLRAEIRLGADRLLAHMDEHTEYYHKCIWWGMDRDRLFMLLDGFLVPGDPVRSLASVVERDPMAVVGNSLVFRVSAGAFLGIGNVGTPAELRRWYIRSQAPREPMRVSLPTSGLYARALMDKCVACEEHMGSVDWVLTDREPELETIGPEGLQSRRAEPAAVTPTPFQAPIINLQNAPAAPAPTGLGGVLEAVTKSDAFRDMAGLAGTQANAAAAMQTAASLASEFGSKALELEKSKQATSSAPQKLENIRRAQDDGLINKEDARGLTQDALKDMNVSPGESRLTTEPVVQSVLARATEVPANPIEIVRGGETIRVGNPTASALLAEAEAAAPKSRDKLALGDKWPKNSELASSGALGNAIAKDSAEYKALSQSTNADIVFKTDACKLMTQHLQTALDALAAKVPTEWPGKKLRITETWREHAAGTSRNLHHEARAADITTDDKDEAKYGRLAGLATECGFGWVYYEDKLHVHVSVTSDTA